MEAARRVKVTIGDNPPLYLAPQAFESLVEVLEKNVTQLRLSIGGGAIPESTGVEELVACAEEGERLAAIAGSLQEIKRAGV